MADLATIDDIEDRLGRELTAAEEARATAYLKDASAAVRRYTGQTFTEVIEDTTILRPTGAFLVLTDLPVTAVTAVKGMQPDGITVGSEITGWVFDGIDRIDLATVGFGWSGDPWWPWQSGPESFQITYDHGVSTVPDDVVGVVCGMVLRVLTSPSSVEGLNGEKIGEYSYTMQQGGGGTPGVTARMSEQDKADLRCYRQHAGSIQARL